MGAAGGVVAPYLVAVSVDHVQHQMLPWLQVLIALCPELEVWKEGMDVCDF